MNKQNKRPNCLLKEIYTERENKMKKKLKPQKFREANKWIQTVYKYKTSQLNHDLKCKQKQHTCRCKWCIKKI